MGTNEIIMLCLTISVLILYQTHQVESQSSEVPDNKVWTSPTATLWLGKANPNITCKFIGTPYAVYWFKGQQIQSATQLLTWYQNVVTYPDGMDESFGITDDFSLIFRQLEASDEGRYFCRVSNYNGFLIENYTDVRVLDPQYSIAYTTPSLTSWKGYTETLPCDFLGAPTKVIWNKVQGAGSSQRVETVLRYSDGAYEVGGDRRFSWSINFALVVHDLSVLDEGSFTCQVLKSGGIKLENVTVLTVYAHAEEPTTRIKQCENHPLQTNIDNRERYCIYNVSEHQESFQLDCSVHGAKPVPSIGWFETETEREINNTKPLSTKRSDGTVDLKVTLTSTIDTIGRVKNFTCRANGTAVNATTAEYTIGVQLVSVKGMTGGSSNVATAVVILMFFIITIFITVFAFIVLYKRKLFHRVLPEKVL